MYISLNLDVGEKLICNLCGKWIKEEGIAWLNENENTGKPIPPEIYEVLCTECYEKQ